MADMFHQWVVLIFFISSIHLSYSQFNSPQNIQTFYPFSPISIARTPNSPRNDSIYPSSVPTRLPEQPPPPLPPQRITLLSKGSSKKAVITGVVATVLSASVISGVFIIFFLRNTQRKREKKVRPNPYADSPTRDEFRHLDGNFKGVIVDGDGSDVLYWREIERGRNIKRDFNREEFSVRKDEEKEEENSAPKGMPSNTGGPSRFDGELMEALFGSVATNPKSLHEINNSSSPNIGKTSPPYYITILDPQKSQNIAITLRSLAISRKELINALMDGQGLNKDTLEKLTKMPLTKEEEFEILSFNGNPVRLADAESFLFHLLKSFPSAFPRFNAMLLRSNYDSEIFHLKDCIQTLELGCNELIRTRGMFTKLLEAIPNAANSRANVLETFRNLSDELSLDGKSTLLHYVVEQVIRSEGKSRLMTRSSENYSEDDESKNECIILGLQVIGELSSELSNVKKAANIDYEAFEKRLSSLANHVLEIRPLVAQSATIEGRFVREIKIFLDEAEEEIKVMKEEEKRVMEIVKRTSEYYQLGDSEERGTNYFEMFVIVKDFLGMVDQVCLDIARNLEKRGKETEDIGSSSSSPKFSKLGDKFMS